MPDNEPEASEGAEASESGELSSHAGARAISKAPSVEDRVDHIAGMMERLEWVRGKSAKVLAVEWGLALPTVEGNAAEASRRIVGDKDDAVRDITAGARQLMQSALIARNAKDFTAVASLLADIAGAKAPTKQELSGSLGIGEATPASAADLVRKKFGGNAAMRDPGETPVAPENVPGAAATK